MERRVRLLSVSCAALLALGGCGRSSNGFVDGSDEVPFTVTAPQRIVRAPQVLLRGTALPGTAVAVGSRQTEVDPTGKWRLSVPLDVGRNVLVATASETTAGGPRRSVVVIRKRTAAELAVARRTAERDRKKAAAERRARAAAKLAARQRAAARRAAARQRKAQTAADNGNDVVDYNRVLSPYLSQLIDAPELADEAATVSALRDLAIGESAACRAVIDATVEAVWDTSGTPDDRRARILEASMGIYADC